VEFDLETYYGLVEWATSKEGILVALLAVYLAWFLIPAIQASFITPQGEEPSSIATKVIVFFVVFVLLPPVLLLAMTLNFLGLLGEEEGVEV
jgi:uncharacterized membrane protein required for colicin V production